MDGLLSPWRTKALPCARPGKKAAPRKESAQQRRSRPSYVARPLNVTQERPDARRAGGCVAHPCLHGLDVRAGCDQQRAGPTTARRARLWPAFPAAPPRVFAVNTATTPSRRYLDSRRLDASILAMRREARRGAGARMAALNGHGDDDELATAAGCFDEWPLVPQCRRIRRPATDASTLPLGRGQPLPRFALN